MFRRDLSVVEFEYDFNTYSLDTKLFSIITTFKSEGAVSVAKKTLKVSYDSTSIGFSYWVPINPTNPDEQPFCIINGSEIVFSFLRVDNNNIPAVCPKFGFIDPAYPDKTNLLVSVDSTGNFAIERDGNLVFSSEKRFVYNRHYILLLRINNSGNKATLYGGVYGVVNDFTDMKVLGTDIKLDQPAILVPAFGITSSTEDKKNGHIWMFDYFYYRVNRLPINSR